MAKAAVPAKGGAGDAEGGAAGMGRADLKRMLKFASEEPVRVAFALGGDGKAILVMDRRKPARTLEKELKEAAPDSRNHRFGTAAVDEAQPTLVTFMVNKQAGGVARKLVVALKGTGFSKVEVGTEDGGPPERAEEGQDDAAAPGSGAAPGQDVAAAGGPPGAGAVPGARPGALGGAAGAAAGARTAAALGGAAAGPPGLAPNATADATANPAASAAPGAASGTSAGAAAGAAFGAALGQPPAARPGQSGAAAPTAAGMAPPGQAQAAQAGQAAGAPGAAAPPDTGAMVAELVPLVHQIQAIAAKDPAQKAPLTKLATAAQASLRRAMLSLAPADLDQAAAGIERVRAAVAAAEAPAGHGAPGQGAPGQAHGPAGGAAQGAAQQGGKPLDAAGVMAALAKAAKQAMPVMQSDPARRPALQQQLTQAHASLKAGDLVAAQGHTDDLMRMLGQQLGGSGGSVMSGMAGLADAGTGLAAGHAAAQAAGKAAGPAHQPDPLLAKAAQVWNATCAKAQGELKRVHDAFVAAASGHGIADQLAKTFGDTMQPLHQALDGTLAQKLHEVNAAADHAARLKSAREAKALVEHHRKQTAEHPVLRAIEGNPLVPVGIKAMLHTGLDGIEKVLGKHLGAAGPGGIGTEASGMGSAGGGAARSLGGRG